MLNREEVLQAAEIQIQGARDIIVKKYQNHSLEYVEKFLKRAFLSCVNARQVNTEALVSEYERLTKNA